VHNDELYGSYYYNASFGSTLSGSSFQSTGSFQIAAIGGAKQAFAIEKNPFAAECPRRGLQILSRNEKFPCAADQVHLLEGHMNSLRLWELQVKAHF